MQWWLRRLLPLIAVVALLALAAWLRLVQLDQVPPAPYWEEAALAYDAYSIVQTGKDHHGQAWPIVAFESFGDWKPSGYFYAAAASIKVLGLNLLAVRLPAALAGIVLVVLCAWLARLIHRESQVGWASWPIITLGVAAISPWGIQFSRAAWEVMLATMFFVASVSCEWLWLSQWFKDKKWSWGWGIATVLLAVASMYTYHALRMIAPCVLIWTFFYWVWQTGLIEVKTKTLAQWKTFSVTLLCLGILTIGLLWPLLQNLRSPVIQQRFAETSILNDLKPIESSNDLIEAHHNSFLAKLIYHRYWFQGRIIADQLLSHLDLGFLFLHGDENPRHSMQYFGQLYYLDAIFAAIGLFCLWWKHRKLATWLTGWWLIGTLPAALTLAAPHALRTLATWPVWVLLISYGISEVAHRRVWLLGVIIGAYAILLGWFWHTYTRIYPVEHSQDWQAGYCEMYQQLQPWLDQYPDLPVIISRQVGRPAMYLWFCQSTNPRKVQAIASSILKDQGEFLQFEKFQFVRGVGEIPKLPAIVVVSAAEQTQLATGSANQSNLTVFWKNQPKWFIVKQ